MLITKEVITKWNPTTKKYYENLGYIYTKHNAELVVKIEDLHIGSNIEIEFECDICNKPSTTRYSRYIIIKNKYGKDICRKCMCGVVSQNTRKLNNNNGYGNYDTHDKRKIELRKYLEEYYTLDKMVSNEIGKRLYDNFKSHKDDVYDTAVELGYKIEDISKSMPKDYYINHPEIIKEKLLGFIKEYNRFPKSKEMEKVLRINTHFVSKFGGVNAFRKLIEYDDSSDLIDLRGDYNKSIGELIFANYVCSQGLKDKYTREQYPFPKEEGYFRSDFTFYLENDKDIHIEVWGVKATEINSERAVHYHKIRKIKEKLYEKYSNDLILISINYEIFDKKYDEIQKHLYDMISPYIDLKFKNVSYKKLLSPSSLSDDEIFNEVMMISPDGLTLPTTTDLQMYSAGLYYQILKRGYTYYEFADKYGVKTKLVKVNWTKKLIFEHFSEILKSGKVIDKQTMNEQYSNLSCATEDFGYVTKLKIDYFYKQNKIPSQELDWVINLANGITKTTANYSKSEINKAKKLLDKLYPNIHEEICCASCGREMTKNHIYELYCKKCSESIFNGKMRYIKALFTETEYNNNFSVKAIEPYLLTTKGFNTVSNIKIQSYRNYFNMIWIDVVRKYNKFDDLYNYIIDEFTAYCKIDKNQDLRKFSKEHKYITSDMLVGIGFDKIYKDVGIIKQQYTDDGYKDNFLELVNTFGYIPLYNGFIEKTKINILSYSNKFDLHKDIYDEIVKMYSSDIDYEDYLKRKKEHKSNIGRKSGNVGRIFSEEYLQTNFTEVFDNYFSEQNKYPSKKVFNVISKHDDSTYRRRFCKSWTGICEMYGYKTQQSA